MPQTTEPERDCPRSFATKETLVKLYVIESDREPDTLFFGR